MRLEQVRRVERIVVQKPIERLELSGRLQRPRKPNGWVMCDSLHHANQSRAAPRITQLRAVEVPSQPLKSLKPSHIEL